MKPAHVDARVGKVITTNTHNTFHGSHWPRSAAYRKKEKTAGCCCAVHVRGMQWRTMCPCHTNTSWVCLLRQITVQDGTGAIRIASHSHGCSNYRKDPLSGGLCASHEY